MACSLVGGHVPRKPGPIWWNMQSSGGGSGRSPAPMKPREPRHKVLVRARMKVGTGWHDSCILNISSRGMLMQTADPPARGSYLEVRRGALVIVARVMWANGHRFGVKSQDVLPIDAIVRDVEVPVVGDGVRVGERRQAVRPILSMATRSRHRGRAIEFGFVIALALSAAGFAASEVHALLSAPAEAVTAALNGARGS